MAADSTGGGGVGGIGVWTATAAARDGSAPAATATATARDGSAPNAAWATTAWATTMQKGDL